MKKIQLEPYQNGVILYFNGMELLIRSRGNGIGIEPIVPEGSEADSFSEVGISVRLGQDVIVLQPGGKK